MARKALASRTSAWRTSSSSLGSSTETAGLPIFVALITGLLVCRRFDGLRHRKVPGPKATPESGAARAFFPGPRSQAACVSIDVEGHALRQRQRLRIVDGVGSAAHVSLPGVRAGLPAAARLLLAAKGAADLGARSADIDVGDTAVRALRREESLRFRDVAREDRRGQAGAHGIVHFQRLVKVLVLHHIEDR